MMQDSLLTDVGETFEKNEILLAGANGFLGKTVLALVVDRYPRFKHLHVLIRPKLNVTAEQRFYGKTLASPALAGLVRKRGSEFFRDKISVWSGDVSRPNCGLSRADLESLASRVRLIINCAGRVEFFPPLDDSLSANVHAVENLVRFAKLGGPKLLHVSTCYVSGEADGLVEESEPMVGFYPRRKGPDDRSFDPVAELGYCRERIRQIYNLSTTGPDLGDLAPRREVREKLIALGRQRSAYWGWPNTYTYSKSLGEQIIAAESGLDYGIARPAIVESALRFPFPGWIEGGRTAAPLVLMALGGLKEWPVRRENPLEVVPVDLVASAILVISALLLNGRHERVYQLGTADANPILLAPLVALLDRESRKRSKNHRANGAAFLEALVGGMHASPPRFVSAEEARTRRKRLEKRIGRAEALISRARNALQAAGLPGHDSLGKWTATLRRLALQAMFREQTLEQYLPFIFHNRYIFESENIRRAYTLISERDRELLPWDPERIDWKDYWINHEIRGIEKWVQPEAVRDWTFRI